MFDDVKGFHSDG
jgi:hypothetical protein